MGKARVAATKLTTIPRLEFTSAVNSVRNGDVVKRELEIKNLQEFYWTYSKVVLGYLNNDAKRFHTFVAKIKIFRLVQSSESCSQALAIHQRIQETSAKNEQGDLP